MEKKLKSLFDYQRFAQKEDLAKLISESEDRYNAVLQDDDLASVTAAGELYADKPKTDN